MSTRSLTRIAIAIVIFFIFSNIIPALTIFAVPFTFQTLVILIIPFILSKKEILYFHLSIIIMCLIGLPIMSNFSGGVAVLLGPTAGFIYSWILMMLFIKQFTKQEDPLLRMFIVLCLATLLNLVFGGLWIAFINQNAYLETVKTILVTFMPFGTIKVILAMIIIKKMPIKKIEKSI